MHYVPIVPAVFLAQSECQCHVCQCEKGREKYSLTSSAWGYWPCAIFISTLPHLLVDTAEQKDLPVSCRVRNLLLMTAFAILNIPPPHVSVSFVRFNCLTHWFLELSYTINHCVLNLLNVTLSQCILHKNFAIQLDCAGHVGQILSFSGWHFRIFPTRYHT